MRFLKARNLAVQLEVRTGIRTACGQDQGWWRQCPILQSVGRGRSVNPGATINPVHADASTGIQTRPFVIASKVLGK
eukprot:9468712-Pyramimonas_sp.AAC.1